MKLFFRILSICSILLVFSSCSITRPLTIKTIEPSPVNFSTQIKKIGILNNSPSSFTTTYVTRLEQLIAMEERWLAENGAEATLTGLFDELVQDQRFDTVVIIDNKNEEKIDFGTQPSDAMWNTIATICEENDIDAIFSLTSHETDTQFTFKNAKVDKLDMVRYRSSVSGQEITLKTLIENGWRVYDPKQKILIDEFTSNEQVVATGKGLNSVDALQAIENRKETLIAQSKISGNSYAQRMQPKKIAIQRDYYVTGTRNFELADDKIQDDAYEEAIKLWELEITNSNARISGRACYNLAVLNEFNDNIDAAMSWASKSYGLFKEDATLEYITILESRQAKADVVKQQLANTNFED